MPTISGLTSGTIALDSQIAADLTTGDTVRDTVKDTLNLFPACIGPLICGDETTDMTTGVKLTFRMPFAMTLTGVRASLVTAATGASLFTVDVHESATTVLSTKVTLDASETTSTTAATPAVISDSTLADDAEMTIEVDQVGSTLAGKGLRVWLIGTRT